MDGAAKVLIVDDEPNLREVLAITFRRQGLEVVTASGKRQALEAIESRPEPFPLVVTDLVMPDGSGLEVLEAAKGRTPSTEVIVITAHSTVESAIDAMRKGAYDFLTKPFSPNEVAALAQKALEKSAIVTENTRLKAQLKRKSGSFQLGTSPAMHEVGEMIERVAATKTTVLITGESGTGKERIARLIHRRSGRHDKPFLVVNCGALPEALMESELFGHEKGSFTGAGARTLGLFREADGGTVLLDEVGELPAPLQVKLLRVLQEKKVRPVGSAAEVSVDVRVLAATNRDVEDDVASGKFRQDLYYRLNVIRIEIPKLSERASDIPQLVDTFVKQFSAELGKDVQGISNDALRALSGYSFPGNVRELENIIERAVALSRGPRIGLSELPPTVTGIPEQLQLGNVELPEGGCNLDAVLGEQERNFMLQALERTGGVQKKAAKLLGMTFRSFRYRMHKHGLSAERGDDEGDGEDESGPPSEDPTSSKR